MAEGKSCHTEVLLPVTAVSVSQAAAPHISPSRATAPTLVLLKNSQITNSLLNWPALSEPGQGELTTTDLKGEEQCQQAIGTMPSASTSGPTRKRTLVHRLTAQAASFQLPERKL